MRLIVLGLNHNTAPVKVRERMAVKKEEMPEAYEKLLADGRVFEVCIVSTCNRVEYYLVTDTDLCDKKDALGIVCSSFALKVEELDQYTYFEFGESAVRHIFAVASGLDSLVLGEPQILGQIKDAFHYSKLGGAMGSYLNRLAELTLKAAKHVRTFTGVSENPVSVSYAAVELAKKIFGTLEEASALIIGAGEMCELAARHLSGSGIKSMTVTNRTFEKAKNLAEEFGAGAIDFVSFPDILHEFDIVISSTGATDCIVSAEMVSKAMAKRRNKPMFFIDIAVPRDIDPKAADIENTYIYDIDDLKSVVEANKKEREKEAKKAWEIVEAFNEKFKGTMESLKIVPAIKVLRKSFDEKKQEELVKFCDKHKVTSQKEKDQLDRLLTVTLNKILHTPFTNLKKHATDKTKYSIGEAIDLIFSPKEK